MTTCSAGTSFLRAVGIGLSVFVLAESQLRAAITAIAARDFRALRAGAVLFVLPQPRNRSASKARLIDALACSRVRHVRLSLRRGSDGAAFRIDMDRRPVPRGSSRGGVVTRFLRRRSRGAYRPRSHTAMSRLGASDPFFALSALRFVRVAISRRGCFRIAVIRWSASSRRRFCTARVCSASRSKSCSPTCSCSCSLGAFLEATGATGLSSFRSRNVFSKTRPAARRR